MADKVKQELLLKEKDWGICWTDEEGFPTDRVVITKTYLEGLLEAQLAKAEPLIEKPLCEKIDKLQKKLVTTNVYYLREIQQQKEQIRKDERERMIKSLNLLVEKDFTLKDAISALEDAIEEQALRGGK